MNVTLQRGDREPEPEPESLLSAASTQLVWHDLKTDDEDVIYTYKK